jgi:citrate lyase subunit beta/citryl-CoA lyase
MIETAKSVVNIQDIAEASSVYRLSCLVLGSNDLSKELRLRPGTNREPLFAILGQSVVAARAVGLAILDGMYNRIGDSDGFSKQCRQAVDFGFDGKTLIHPSQVDACNIMFTPDAAAIHWAQRVISAFGESANVDKGVIQVDGTMVERLHLAQAQQTLAIAREAGVDIV